MVTLLKFAAVAGTVALVAGCAPRSEPVVMPAPAIQPEPGFTKF
jgi:hypothetical protein